MDTKTRFEEEAKGNSEMAYYGNRIMSMGIPPTTYFHTQKMQQLQQKQLDTARANAEANSHKNTARKHPRAADEKHH